MKKNKLFLLLALVSVLPLASCGGDKPINSGSAAPIKKTYTVSFSTDGGSAVASVEVAEGKRITEDIADPTKDGYVFAGWYKDAGLTREWKFDVDTVTADLTLYAKWREASSKPTEIGNVAAAFSSALSWYQTGVDSATTFDLTYFPLISVTEETVTDEVTGTEITNKVYTYAEEGASVPGTYTYTDGLVTWTPTVLPAPDIYKVHIDVRTGASLTGQADAELIYARGDGSAAKPFTVFETLDAEYLSANSGSYRATDHLALGADVELAIDLSLNRDQIFKGQFDGRGHTMTITSGNGGLFYTIGTGATVKNLGLEGEVITLSAPSIGALAFYNEGEIENVASGVTVTSECGTVGDLATRSEGGAGGLVGTNKGTIRGSTFNGTVKANIGGGAIAGSNLGRIEECVNKGTLGAGNAVESGKSTVKYSYMGGIAGFNEGTVAKSITTSTGKLLAQRFTGGAEPTGTANNRVIGGLVGYNLASGVVTESVFSGIRCHGDQYVGGIAGINAGRIEYSYSGALYYSTPKQRSYIGARLNVGGIAGGIEAGSVITNCYNSANVYSFKAGDTPFAIAAEATNCVYLTANLDKRASGEFAYGNSVTDAMTAPTGTGNQAVSDAVATGEEDYLLPDFTTLLGDKFIFTAETGTILAWQKK